MNKKDKHKSQAALQRKLNKLHKRWIVLKAESEKIGEEIRRGQHSS